MLLDNPKKQIIFDILKMDSLELKKMSNQTQLLIGGKDLASQAKAPNTSYSTLFLNSVEQMFGWLETGEKLRQSKKRGKQRWKYTTVFFIPRAHPETPE